jgi:hypothetical protein
MFDLSVTSGKCLFLMLGAVDAELQCKVFCEVNAFKCLIQYHKSCTYVCNCFQRFLRHQVLESLYCLLSLAGDSETVEGSLNVIEACFRNVLVIQALRENAMEVVRLRESLDVLSVQSHLDSIAMKASSLRDLIDGR